MPPHALIWGTEHLNVLLAAFSDVLDLLGLGINPILFPASPYRCIILVAHACFGDLHALINIGLDPSTTITHLYKIIDTQRLARAMGLGDCKYYFPFGEGSTPQIVLTSSWVWAD